MSVTDAIANAKALDAAVGELSDDQRPEADHHQGARKSIAPFKLREGQNVGAMVTLRGERMWDFLDRC